MDYNQFTLDVYAAFTTLNYAAVGVYFCVAIPAAGAIVAAAYWLSMPVYIRRHFEEYRSAGF